MNSAMPKVPASILVVDDTPANLQLLSEMLKERGYKVRPAPDGETALRGARIAPPDLILLDITMPEMDGYEVCSRLKADARLQDIPVIFISALNEPLDKVRAFQAGGVDYVSKPFNFEEVDARVRTHLELRQRTRELAASLGQLRELEQLRDSLTHMVAHDMRSPLLAIQLTLDLFSEEASTLKPMSAQMLLNARTSVTMLVEMIGQMLDVSRMEAGEMALERTRGNLVETLRNAVELQRPLAGKRRLGFSAGAPLLASYDANLLRRVVGNLIGNAIKFTPPDGDIRVSVVPADGIARVEVTDNGAGIAPEYHDRIFEKFGQVANQGGPRVGTGLGLTFARMAIEAHGGNMGVVSALGKGSTFWFTLPVTADSKL